MQHNVHFFLTTIILLLISITDSKYKKIPNGLTAAVAVLSTVSALSDVLIRGTSPLKMLAGAVAGLIILLPAFFITGKSFGAGDKKLFMALGISLGIKGVMFLVLFTMVGAAVYILFIKKGARTQSVALAPFIMYSYILIYCPGI